MNIRFLTFLLLVDYVSSITQNVFHKCKHNARQLKWYMANRNADVPPSLATTATRPDKEEAIQEFVSRYAKSSLIH